MPTTPHDKPRFLNVFQEGSVVNDEATASYSLPKDIDKNVGDSLLPSISATLSDRAGFWSSESITCSTMWLYLSYVSPLKTSLGENHYSYFGQYPVSRTILSVTHAWMESGWWGNWRSFHKVVKHELWNWVLPLFFISNGNPWTEAQNLTATGVPQNHVASLRHAI